MVKKIFFRISPELESKKTAMDLHVRIKYGKIPKKGFLGTRVGNYFTVQDLGAAIVADAIARFSLIEIRYQHSYSTFPQDKSRLELTISLASHCTVVRYLINYCAFSTQQICIPRCHTFCILKYSQLRFTVTTSTSSTG